MNSKNIKRVGRVSALVTAVSLAVALLVSVNKGERSFQDAESRMTQPAATDYPKLEKHEKDFGDPYFAGSVFGLYMLIRRENKCNKQ